MAKKEAKQLTLNFDNDKVPYDDLKSSFFPNGVTVGVASDDNTVKELTPEELTMTATTWSLDHDTTVNMAPEVFDTASSGFTVSMAEGFEWSGEEWPHEKLRQKYPALNDIWEKYCMVKHMCEQREKEERE